MSTVTFNYGNWNFWSIYDTPNKLYGNHKVTFDGPNKLILVNYGETELDFREDVYSNWKEWLHDPNLNNEQYLEAISVVGGDPLPGDRALGATYFLENGWRMRTWEGDHELTVTGNVFTRSGVPLFVPTLEGWTITINLNTSTLVETIFGQANIATGDIDAIASAVWNNTIQGSDTGLTILNSIVADIAAIPDNVWDEIIDSTKNQSAREKLRQIATKTQDIALR
jgi:hypothetical protein